MIAIRSKFWVNLPTLSSTICLSLTADFSIKMSLLLSSNWIGSVLPCCQFFRVKTMFVWTCELHLVLSPTNTNDKILQRQLQQRNFNEQIKRFSVLSRAPQVTVYRRRTIDFESNFGLNLGGVFFSWPLNSCNHQVTATISFNLTRDQSNPTAFYMTCFFCKTKEYKKIIDENYKMPLNDDKQNEFGTSHMHK